MSYRLICQNDPDRNLQMNNWTWFGILELAEKYGWNPRGTVTPDMLELAGFYSTFSNSLPRRLLGQRDPSRSHRGRFESRRRPGRSFHQDRAASPAIPPSLSPQWWKRGPSESDSCCGGHSDDDRSLPARCFSNRIDLRSPPLVDNLEHGSGTKAVYFDLWIQKERLQLR